MVVEVAGDDLYFQTIARSGKTVDSGSIHRAAKPWKGPPRGAVLELSTLSV